MGQRIILTALERVAIWHTADTDSATGGVAPQPVGLNNAVNMAQGASGGAYDYGGAGQGNRGYDCSGFMSGIYNNLTGKNERFTTDSDFSKLGFQPGYDPNSHFNIGTNGQSGENGHMAGELGGVNVESASPSGHHPGAPGTMYGGEAYGPNHPLFSQQWHLPNSMVVGHQPQQPSAPQPSTPALPQPPKPPSMPGAG